MFQNWAGGNFDKQKLALAKYENQKHILEVGCSIGNIAQAFTKFEDLSYTGIDIDPVVIGHAQASLRRFPNFEFFCQDLKTFRPMGPKFDFILFAGMCHHVSDRACCDLLRAGQSLLSETGKMVVVDILKPEPEDTWLLHKYIRIDQGEFIRSDASLRGLIESVTEVEEAEIHYVGASPISFPIVARFGVYTLA